MFETLITYYLPMFSFVLVIETVILPAFRTLKLIVTTKDKVDKLYLSKLTVFGIQKALRRKRKENPQNGRG